MTTTETKLRAKLRYAWWRALTAEEALDEIAAELDEVMAERDQALHEAEFEHRRHVCYKIWVKRQQAKHQQSVERRQTKVRRP
jgi:hypothetical protein